MQNQNDTVQGYPLFNEITDVELQRRNRAVIMTNLLEDNWDSGKVSGKGVALQIQYMNAIPPAERKDLLDEFVKQANERGFKIG